ncbi:MAG: hypothetical protein IKZ19_01015 [Clostridia bacterium]|nr:hypothetical protein [Clostridia bacterium]
MELFVKKKLIILLFVLSFILSACGNAEPETTTAGGTVTEVSSENSTESESEETSESVEATEVSSENSTESESEESSDSVEATEVPPEDIEAQLLFEEVKSEPGFVYLWVESDLPGGENSFESIASGFGSYAYVNLDTGLYAEIYGMLSEPNMVPAEDAGWAEESFGELKLANAETEVLLRFGYTAGCEALTSNTCSVTVGDRELVYSLSPDAADFFKVLFDRICISSASTWEGDPLPEGVGMIDGVVSPELSEEEKNLQAELDRAAEVRITVESSRGFLENSPYSIEFSIAGCIFDVTDPETVSALRGAVSEASLVKTDLTGMGRTTPTVRVIFISGDGTETVFYFLHDFCFDSTPDLHFYCGTVIGGKWYIYDLRNSPREYLDCFFDSLYLKTAETLAS